MHKYLKISHICPICNERHDTLITYQLVNTSSILFPKQFVTNLNSNKTLSFIAAHGFCGKRRYNVKVGIENDKVTDVVIYEEK